MNERFIRLLREYSFFELILCFGLVVAIHEDISLGGVSMHIAKEEDVSAVKCLLHH